MIIFVEKSIGKLSFMLNFFLNYARIKCIAEYENLFKACLFFKYHVPNKKLLLLLLDEVLT